MSDSKRADAVRRQMAAIPTYDLIDPPASTDVDAAWEALDNVMRHAHTEDDARAMVRRHRPRIEAAIRAELDRTVNDFARIVVERERQSIGLAHDPRHWPTGPLVAGCEKCNEPQAIRARRKAKQ